MKNILIIEDERLSFDRLNRLLLDYNDTMQIDGPLTCISDVVNKLREKNDYDVIFSDIHLKDSLVFEAFHEKMPNAPVIFTTAYDEYALEAFRNNGVGYLLKPISRDDLNATIERVESMKGQGNAVEQIHDNLASAARDMQCFRERFLITKGDVLIPLRTKDISYIRKEDSGVFAYNAQGESYRLSMTMNELESQLDPKVFFRLNRQYLANIDCIKKISFFFSSKLIVRLDGCKDEQIVVSKEKSAQFKQWMEH